MREKHDAVQGRFSGNGELCPYHDHQLLYQLKHDDSSESEILPPALYVSFS